MAPSAQPKRLFTALLLFLAACSPRAPSEQPQPMDAVTLFEGTRLISGTADPRSGVYLRGKQVDLTKLETTFAKAMAGTSSP